MAQPAPTDAHRPRRPRLRIGATEPSVLSLSPVGRSIAHYGPYAPPLRLVPRSTFPPAPDTAKLQHHCQRGVTLPDGHPAAPTTTHRPGPPSFGRPTSPNPPPDTRNPQHHRQRGSTPLDGRPAAPTANPRPGPSHSGPSSRTALRACACRQPSRTPNQTPAHRTGPGYQCARSPPFFGRQLSCAATWPFPTHPSQASPSSVNFKGDRARKRLVAAQASKAAAAAPG